MASDHHGQGWHSVNPGGPEVSEQHCPGPQSLSQKQSSLQPPLTHVNRGGQLSVKIVDVQGPPSAGAPKTHRPVGFVVWEGSTSHCCRALQPALWTGSHTATVPEQLPPSVMSLSGAPSKVTSSGLVSSRLASFGPASSRLATSVVVA
jgi:hypothetical protein